MRPPRPRTAAPRDGTDTPIRFRALRSDSSIESAQRMLERKFRLPAGCVRFVYPSGYRARQRITVGKLMQRWAK